VFSLSYLDCLSGATPRQEQNIKATCPFMILKEQQDGLTSMQKKKDGFDL